MIGWANALEQWPNVDLSYNVAPTRQIAAFRNQTGEAMRWGMIPPWAKQFDSKFATFNARIETVADKPTFGNAWLKSQRCLIPMAGYYEWCGDKGNKQPLCITDLNAGGLVVAGLYESWGDNQLSCTVLTMAANSELSHIHPRQPIMLNPKTAKIWLDGESDQNTLIGQTRPSIIYYPVSKAIGNVRNDTPELIEPIDT
jgi:putative SOS response-associated peptidase YedK